MVKVFRLAHCRLFLKMISVFWQIVQPVKWEQMIHEIYQRKSEEYYPRTFECGPGRGLTTILKQVNAKAWDKTFNIEA